MRRRMLSVNRVARSGLRGQKSEYVEKKLTQSCTPRSCHVNLAVLFVHKYGRDKDAGGKKKISIIIRTLHGQ